jgi:magnesium chelatase family protein
MKVACIRSLSHNSSNAMALVDPPLRSPHHSATSVALTGGGNRAMPGEVSLAHLGVLFLDEFAEFKPSVLDSLREPMEAGEITITRANYRVKYPARFQLIAAMNPCPCGYCSDPKRHCRCAPSQLQHYQKRLSGPLLDRIDLQVELPALSSAELLDASEDDYDAVSRWRQAKKQVKACRALQLQRSGKLNSNLSAEEVETLCRLSSTQRKQLAMIMDELGLSARALHRVLRVARTLADFDEQPAISEAHLLEAIAMRRLQFLNR